MNRLSRLSAILIQLQGKRLVKAQELADRFNISLRTVYRDVHALQEGGVPVIGEAGTGYTLMEGYKLPPVLFTEDEASALLTASKLMQHMTDETSAKHYTSALDKIRAVLRLAEKDHVAELDKHVAVVAHPTFVHERPAELHLSKILKALSAGMAVQFVYHSIGKNESLQRTAEPVGIFRQGSHWYLVAHCRLRKDYRHFRTDRIAKLQLTAEKGMQEHPPLQAFINRTACEKSLHKVVIDVAPHVLPYFGEQKYYNGFLSEEMAGDKMRMTFLTASPEGFARWFLLFGEWAEIVEPLSLNDRVAAVAKAVLKKLPKAEGLLT